VNSSGSRWFFQLNTHLIVLNLHVKPWLADLRAEAMLARPHVKLPAVPWAGQDSVLQSPLPQRSACMRANAIQHVPLISDMKHRKQPSFSDNFCCFSRCKRSRWKQWNESRL
jgi:hypothetical protein